MRLIDADVLKQHIDKLPALPDGNFAGNHSALKALINMQPTIEPEQRWIPVSERPPEEDGMYYVTVRDSKGDIDAVPCLWFSDKWGINGFEVIAWIKIPEPYKGEA